MQNEVSRLKDIKEQIKELNSIIKTLNAEKADVELALMQEMDQAGFDQIRTDSGTVSLRTTIVPTVTDWEEFYQFMLENKALYMMERRASAAAFRDYLELNEIPPPGVDRYEKKSISLLGR